MVAVQRFFIYTSRKIKTEINRARSIFCATILVNCFLQNLNASVPQNLSYFIENLMIREGGAFTLLGSKPMTEFDIVYGFNETEEELKESYQELLNYNKLHPNRKIDISYEDYRDRSIETYKSSPFLNKKNLWEDWEKSFGKRVTPNYILTQRIGHYSTGLLVNLSQTVYILKKYKDEFVQITGEDFNPLTIVQSIDDASSSFWDKVFKDHYLHGLLLGYGEKNSYLFAFSREREILEKTSLQRLHGTGEIHRNIAIWKRNHIEIEDLTFPYFATFNIADAEVDKFQREKQEIVKFLSGRNLQNFFLNCFDIEISGETAISE